MTKAELIERHAQEAYATIGGKSTIEACRDFARHNIDDLWPLIVEYVAEWIETHDMSPVGEHLTQVWKEEAGDA